MPSPMPAFSAPTDRGPTDRTGVERATVHARYLVVAPADPGLLPRLLEPFSRLGTVPSRIHASAEAGDGSELTVDMRLVNVAPRTAELIEHALRRVVGVSQLIAVVDA